MSRLALTRLLHCQQPKIRSPHVDRNLTSSYIAPKKEENNSRKWPGRWLPLWMYSFHYVTAAEESTLEIFILPLSCFFFFWCIWWKCDCVMCLEEQVDSLLLPLWCFNVSKNTGSAPLDAPAADKTWRRARQCGHSSGRNVVIFFFLTWSKLLHDRTSKTSPHLENNDLSIKNIPAFCPTSNWFW